MLATIRLLPVGSREPRAQVTDLVPRRRTARASVAAAASHSTPPRKAVRSFSRHDRVPLLQEPLSVTLEIVTVKCYIHCHMMNDADMGARRYSIGELAELTGVSRRTVHFYVQRRLTPVSSASSPIE